MKVHALSILGLLVAVSLVATACGTGTVPTAAPQVTEAPPAATQAPAPIGPVATTEQGAKPLVIAILTSSTVGDMAWSQSLGQAKDALAQKYGDRVEVRLAENVVWGEETSKTMEQFIADGANVIVDGVTAGEFTTKVAQAHPDVKFLRTDPSGLPNEETFWYNGPQVAYLVGMAAGLMTKSNEIGYVNAFDMPLFRLEISAMALGAQSVNPEATVSVATVNSWYDPATVKQASEALIASGVDVLAGSVSDPANNVAIAEGKQVWAIGVMGDTRTYAPTMWLTGSIISFPTMLNDQIGRILDGKWEGNGAMRFYGVPDGMTLAEWGPNVPQEVKDKVDAVLQRIINENYDPLAGPIYDKEGKVVLAQGKSFTGLEILQGVPWLVKGVEGLQ